MQPSQNTPFPTDSRLREDIGLLPLAALRPPLPQRFTPPPSPHFPIEDRLRDDIGLPPLGEGVHDIAPARSLWSMIQRIASAGATLTNTLVAARNKSMTALATMRQARHHARTR